MLHHALLPPCDFGRHRRGRPTPPKQGDYRNMFPDDGTMKNFEGYGPGAEERTRRMLTRLAVRMAKEGEKQPDAGNPEIPAGYTYLGQLVSHDIVQSLPAGPDATDTSRDDANLRVERLMLDTIYGRGPGTSCSPYAVPKRPSADRTRLRLGKCRLDGARPAGGPALDIPRIGCPEIDNRPNRGATEALLADPRNDVSLIISQLTVLFHLLHNWIESAIAVDHARSGETDRDEPARRLAKARKASAYVFRQIVDGDLMPRLLCDSALTRLRKACKTGDFLDAVDDPRLPFEFSHAAYRVGHSMVRGTYAINDDHPFTGVKDVIRFTSDRRPFEMPLASDWLVQWSRFFKLSDVEPNLSRLIGPSVARALGVNDLFPTEEDEYGGLVLVDLLRGAEAGHRSVDSLISKLPNGERKEPFLDDPAERARQIEAWLRDGDSAADGDTGLDDDDIAKIAEDPPLLFFILLEADKLQGGHCLGPVGSMVVGETVYGALYKTRSMIEDDPDMPSLMRTLFPSNIPGTMPELIQHLVASGDLPNI